MDQIDRCVIDTKLRTKKSSFKSSFGWRGTILSARFLQSSLSRFFLV